MRPLLALLLAACGGQTATRDIPNIVVVFIDDMGYADIGPFGVEGIETPHLDRMATDGVKFTDFQVTTAVCSASRASLLTGAYHRRIGISGAYGPRAKAGIHSDEVTLAEICKQKGYATACFGKWHLGHHPKFLPLQHGFDEYYGLPYSNDMWPLHPDYADLPPDAVQRKQGYPNLPLIEGNRVVDAEVTGADQARLTTEYTERAVSFIERNSDRPFFLYLPHSMVHVPLFVSDKFAGKSDRGLFGDVVMELDWSMGQIFTALDEQGVADNTLVIFTSDNGPWLSYGDHAGSTGGFREGKGTMFEGGTRVPALMRWPSRIPAGSTVDELTTSMDILPTVAALIGADLPAHPIDGQDISSLLFDPAKAVSPYEAVYGYYAGGQLHTVRTPRYKLHLPHRFRTLSGRAGGSDGQPVPYDQAEIGLELFDLMTDPGETTNVAAAQPEVLARLQALAEAARADLGDTLTDREGAGRRPVGRLGPGDPELVW